MTNKTKYYLKIEKIFKKIDNKIILNDISFNVNKGEFVVLLGPSGSGKTSLLQSINGLFPYDSGKVFFGDKEIISKNLKNFRKSTGMIFQHYNLVENLNVINNVLTGLLATTNILSFFYLFSKKQRIKALKCLDKVNLLDKAYEKVKNLSGGQKQRVGIARALIQKPHYLLIDEPVSNLDPVISLKIMTLLRELCEKEGLGIICSLHQVDLAFKFSDRIITIIDGSVTLDAVTDNINPDTIYRSYA